MATRSYKETIQNEYQASWGGRTLVLTDYTPPPASTFADGRGTVGHRFPTRGRRTETAQELGFSFGLEPTYADVADIFPDFFCGSSGTGEGAWAGYTKIELPSDPSGTDGYNDFIVDYSHAQKIYADALLNKMTISFSGSDPIKLMLEAIGTTAPTNGTENLGTADDSSMARTADAACTIGTDTYYPESGEIAISHSILTRPIIGSIVPKITGADVFECTGSLTFTLNADVWDHLLAYIDSSTGFAFTWKATAGNYGFGVALADIIFQGPLPSISGEGQHTHSLPFIASGTSSDMVYGYYDLA
jgi:hypothetical protein